MNSNVGTTGQFRLDGQHLINRVRDAIRTKKVLFICLMFLFWPLLAMLVVTPIYAAIYDEFYFYLIFFLCVFVGSDLLLRICNESGKFIVSLSSHCQRKVVLNIYYLCVSLIPILYLPVIFYVENKIYTLCCLLAMCIGIYGSLVIRAWFVSQFVNLSRLPKLLPWYFDVRLVAVIAITLAQDFIGSVFSFGLVLLGIIVTRQWVRGNAFMIAAGPTSPLIFFFGLILLQVAAVSFTQSISLAITMIVLALLNFYVAPLFYFIFGLGITVVVVESLKLLS